MLLARMLLLLTALAVVPGQEALRLDGGELRLPAGEERRPVAVAPRGARLTASSPVRMLGAVTLDAAGPAGLEATVIARCLRGVEEDDWRRSQRVAGTRRDAQLDQPTAAFGTPAEWRAWGIAGSDGDWDSFSMQWDGWLAVPEDGTDLATRSDDGSRMWLDRDGDGRPGAGEWAGNGWGVGQGATSRIVHARVAAGIYRIRVQVEEGGGGNACQLQWRRPGRDIAVVPADALRAAAVLTVDGPVTLAGPVTGPGLLRLGDGVRLAAVPACAWLVAGRVELAADVGTGNLSLAGRLALAGHRLELGQISGEGTIDLQGGELALPAGSHAVRVEGRGRLRLTGDDDTVLLGLGPEVEVATGAGALRTPERCIAGVVPGAPLVTILPLALDRTGPCRIEADILVPPDAAAGLQVAPWRAGLEGGWFQDPRPVRLPPGRHRLAWQLDGGAGLVAEGHGGTWGPVAAQVSTRVGLALFADAPGTGRLRIDARLLPAVDARTPGARLVALDHDPLQGAATGRRWQVSLRPDPEPGSADDPGDFSCWLQVRGPDGAERRYAAFRDQAVERRDRGDRETFADAGAPRWSMRFRPRQAGTHRLRLVARWRGGATVACDLPDLTATGAAWDGIAHVDAADPRFYSAGGGWVWPLGHNLNSVYDVRSKGCLATELTPDRGSFAREAYLERLAAAGGTGCEVWLAPWNLGLEWIPRWSGYHGAGRYHEGHAWALDRLLDLAERRGMRINLSIFNHGMAREGGGAEEDWRWHPYRQANGGMLERPRELFTDPRARVLQERLFRYLAARYGDSPAVLGWKLWAEVNLAHAEQPQVRDWHAWAAAAFARNDPWRHPVTTHWCGDWNSVDREIGALPGLDYLTIDAYHGEGTLIADLLAASVADPARPGSGLGGLGKPILVTEFGGSAGACARPRMAAEHAIGPWAGLMGGHAGSPMLWWFEWIAQEDAYAPYRAVAAFIAGEDLRGRDAGPRLLAATSPGARLWCRAWVRPGRILGYLLDGQWGRSGGEGATVEKAVVTIGEQVAAGSMRLEWWDTIAGGRLSVQEIAHPGGVLRLEVPVFRRHIALKLIRREGR